MDQLHTLTCNSHSGHARTRHGARSPALARSAGGDARDATPGYLDRPTASGSAGRTGVRPP